MRAPVVERLAEDLLEHHGLRDWTVAYDGAKKRAGICRFGPRVLGLSAPLTTLHSEVEVRDNGRGLRRTKNPGHGLVGVRERVALYDGTVDVSNDPAGGVVLTATLPTGRSA